MRILVDCRMYNGVMHGLARSDYMTARAMAALEPEWEFGLLACSDAIESLADEFPNVSTVMTKARPFSLREHCDLPKLIQDWKPALFHATSIAVPHRIPARSAVTVPDLTMYHYARSFMDKLYFRHILKPVLKKCQKIGVYSRFCADDLCKTLGIAADKICIIPQGADNENYRQISREEALEAKGRLGIGRHFLLCVTNPKPHKNLFRLLEAWKKLKQEIKGREFVSGFNGEVFSAEDLQLAAVTDTAPWIEERIQEFPDVKILSRISDDDLMCLYQHCEFLVFPSLSEGFGLPAAEAMKAGKPCAVSDTASLPEVAGRAGLYFDPLSEEDICAKMNQLLSDAELYKRLQSFSIKEAEKFTWENTARCQLDMYRQALQLPV